MTMTMTMHFWQLDTVFLMLLLLLLLLTYYVTVAFTTSSETQTSVNFRSKHLRLGLKLFSIYDIIIGMN
jgi:uncharacterized protein YpmS